MVEKDELTKMMDEPEPTDPEAKIPWCKLGYTVKDSKEKCPLGGCWKYRCYDSKLNASWHERREKHFAEKFGVE